MTHPTALRLAAAAAGLTAVVTGCATHPDHPAPGESATARAASVTPAVPGGDDHQASAPAAGDALVSGDDVGGDPAGTPTELALRYLNALRTGDWATAATQLSWFERWQVARRGTAGTVGRDVLRHATGDTGELPPCTSAWAFTRDAVLAACGDARVVVHVGTLRGFRGVQVSDALVDGDHPGQPHTHAATPLL